MAGKGDSPLTAWAGPPERRQFRRWLVSLPTSILADGRQLNGSIRDISPGGARIQLADAEAPPLGTAVRLNLDGYGAIEAEVRHAYAGLVDLMFLHDGDGETRLARHLVEHRPERMLRRQQVQLPATMRVRGSEQPCVVVNLSLGGGAISVGDVGQLAVGDEIWLEVPGRGGASALVRRLDGNIAGLTLLGDLTTEVAPGRRRDAAAGSGLSGTVLRALRQRAKRLLER